MTVQREHARTAAATGKDTVRNPWQAYLLAILILMVALWLLPLRRSLWVDEAGTYWTIKDGLQETLHRALRYQGQSPLYYVLTWLTLAAGGRSEWTLRLPSILAAGGAAFLLYRLGVLLFDRQTGLMAVIALVGLRGVVFAATNARPYALGLLLLVGAALALVR
jgi:mannosyltransferase